MPLTEDSGAALSKAKPLVQKYLDTADRLVKAARVGQASAEQMVPALQTAFSELEEKMAALSDSIEKMAMHSTSRRSPASP